MTALAAKLTVRRAVPQDQIQIAQLVPNSGKIAIKPAGFSQSDLFLLTEQNGQAIGLSQLHLLPQLNALGLVASIRHLWLAKTEFAESIYTATSNYAKQQGAIRIETTCSREHTPTMQTKALAHANHLE